MDVGRFFGGDLALLLPELFVRAAACLLLAGGAVVATSPRWEYPLIGQAWGGLTVVVLLVARRLEGGQWATADRTLRGGRLVHDGLATGLSRVLRGAGVGTLLGAKGEIGSSRLWAFEYPLLRLFAILGSRLLLRAHDLRTRYLAIELQSLCLYVLAAFGRGSAHSTEAGLKYFVLGALASGLLLYGCSLVYGLLGATGYEERGRLLSVGGTSEQGAVRVGFTLIVVALLFKRAVAPFHRWSPDVIEGAPRSASRYLAAVTKVAVVGALLRLCWGPFAGLREGRLPLLLATSALSRVIGALGALRQRRVKRFLAYSTIGHRGYLLRGVASGSLLGVQGVVVYRLVYVVRSVTVWSALRACRRPKWDGSGWSKDGVASEPVVYRTDLAGLSRTNPALARTLTVARFSRAGIPPRAGFRAKFGVFFAARDGALYGLAVVGVLSAVVGTFYYLRWVKIRYFDGDPERGSIGDRYQRTVSREVAWVRGSGRRARRLLRVYPTALLVTAHHRSLSLAV